MENNGQKIGVLFIATGGFMAYIGVRAILKNYYSSEPFVVVYIFGVLIALIGAVTAIASTAIMLKQSKIKNQEFINRELERRKPMTVNELKITANHVRQDIVTAVHSAKSGHPGGSLSAADIYTYLYFAEMNINPEEPLDTARDRFVLSKGHTAPGYYSVLAERGFFDKKELLNLRHTGAMLQGHPDKKHIPGVDMSSGSLGQGFSAAVGMALGAKMQGREFRTYCLCGDGEIQEGQIWEAAMFAGARKLDNLVLIVDNNNLQIDGTIEEVCSPYPITDKLKAFNFNVIEIDGHDMEQIADAFKKARETKDMPTAIVAKTIKGKGVSFMENQAGWHGKAPSDEQFEQAIKELKEEEAELCQK